MICWRKSGEAPTRSQCASSAVTATPTCVRGLAAGSPRRARLHCRQAQFHCGNPPPAADPKMTHFMRAILRRHPQGRKDFFFEKKQQKTFVQFGFGFS
jgi:hypothetical protein